MSSSLRIYLLYFLFFTFAFTVHLIGLNRIGRTWDEPYKIDTGFVVWKNILSLDFSLNSWKNIDSEYHPLMTKYIYGFFIRPEVIKLGTAAKPETLTPDQQYSISTGNYILTGLVDNWYLMPYDYTLPRTASAFLSSLAILITIILASRLLGRVWSFLAGTFLLLSPRFLFLGQLVTYESLSVFFLCAAAICFCKLLQNTEKLRYYIYVGIFCGLGFATRYNNVYCLFLLFGWLLIDYFVKKQKKIFNLKLVLIPTLTLLVDILIWPLTWHQFPKYLIESMTQAGGRAHLFSGYFLHYLLITTPMLILLGLILGIIFSIKERKYWNYVFMWWFFSVLIFFSIFSDNMGGTRYISAVYPALGILSAYGYYKVLKKRWVYLLAPIIFFLIVGQVKVYPYYLDYFNEFVGGPSGAAKHYEFSWWGEGQREVGMWMNNNLPNGSSVGLIVTPKYVFPQLRRDLKFEGFADEKSKADYIVLSKTDESAISPEFFKTHKLIYQAKADGEPLVSLLKRIK